MSLRSQAERKKRRALREGGVRERRGYTPDPEKFYNLKIGGKFTPRGDGGGSLTFYDRDLGEVRTIQKQPMTADDPTPAISQEALEAML